MLRNFTASNRKLLYVLLAISDDSNLHLRIFRSFQSVLCFLIRHFLSDERFVIHHYNLVTRQQTSPFSRTVLDDVLDVDGIFTNDKFDTDSRK